MKLLNLTALFSLAAMAANAQANLTVTGAKVNMANAVYMSTNNISVNSTGAVNVASSTIKIAGTISNSGILDVTNGTAETNGNSPQTIPSGAFTKNTILHFRVSNNTTFNGEDTITGTLGFNSSNKTLYPQGLVTLKSTAGNDARFIDITNNGALSGNNVAGDVIVERYVPAKRAFRFLTAPVNSTTSIHDNWQEGVNNSNTSNNLNPLPNYGTHITGVGNDGNGFDATNTTNRSMFTFNPTTQVWDAVANTWGTFTAGTGYRILVRGSRSTNLNENAPPSSNTTLRAKGQLIMNTLVMAKPGGGGSVGMPTLSTTLNGYSLVGNPYACPIDWKLMNRTDLSETFTIFDPTVVGTNGRGAFVTYNNAIGGGVVSNPSSQINNHLQSGQSFFVQTTGPNPSLTFKETYKTSVYRSVYRSSSDLPYIGLQLYLPERISTNEAADGLFVFYSDDFSDSLAGEDSYKMTNLDENIAISKLGSLLSIEGKKPATENDTIQVRMWQMNVKTYDFKVTMAHFDNTLECYLEDTYLNTSTRIYNDSAMYISFDVTADAASKAPLRFRFVFKTASVLPVRYTIVNAYEKDKGISVDWSAVTEPQTSSFVIEKSENGKDFTPLGTVKAKVSTGASSSYNIFDTNPVDGDNYYRIKSVSTNGSVTYSSIAKVHVEKGIGTIYLAQTANSGNTIGLVFKNAIRGKYNVMLLSSSGQLIYSGSINYGGGYTNEQIRLNSTVASGIYQLHLSNGDFQKTLPVLLQ